MQLFLLFGVLLIGATNGWRLPIDDYQYEHSKCPKNELYMEMGLACEPTCENPKRNGCPHEIIFNVCQCEEGFLRRADKKCVKPIDCDVIGRVVHKCEENESLEPCQSGCEPSCDIPEPSECIHECVTGCHCDKGFLRRSDGKCVYPTECNITTTPTPTTPTPTTCPENEFLEDCHRSCSDECPNFRENISSNLRRMLCESSPCKKGCSCEEGLRRNYRGRCVKESQCPQPATPTTPTPPTTTETPCPKNEFKDDCGQCYLSTCPSWTADGLVDKYQSYSDCISICQNGCTCKRGLYRNHEGRCVRPADCPPPGHECKLNETFKIVGSGCEPSCKIPNMSCEAVTKMGCFCKTGFLRNPEGECVKETDCPYEDLENKCKSVECENGDSCLIHEGKPLCVSQEDMASLRYSSYFELTASGIEDERCQINEIFINCKTNCSERKCNEEPKTCPDMCNGTGCACQEGFFRDVLGECITDAHCHHHRWVLDQVLFIASLAYS